MAEHLVVVEFVAQEYDAPRSVAHRLILNRWDITYLATSVRGAFVYLYLIMDICSRKIVGWEVYAEESAWHALQRRCYP